MIGGSFVGDFVGSVGGFVGTVGGFVGAVVGCVVLSGLPQLYKEISCSSSSVVMALATEPIYWKFIGINVVVILTFKFFKLRQGC